MKRRVKDRVAACARLGFAFSILAGIWGSANAAESAVASKLEAEFRVVAESDLLVLGPVDLVEQSKARVQVLGQWIPVSEKSVNQHLEGLLGHVLAVYGSIAADGAFEVSDVREQTSLDYVPGATHVYLKGSIASVDSLVGTARIGSLSINYTNALHSLVADDVAVGTVASFSGLEFAGTNKLYADNASVHSTSRTVQALGQTGSGLDKADGQTGSGLVKADGQTGSGLVKADGQTGSGLVKAEGQTGSGLVKAAGQTGSGLVKADGQTGSGLVKAEGQTGSGLVKAEGQTGSGLVKADGQTGSGLVKADGQTGSGLVKTEGQTGSGLVKAAGQTGSGLVN